MIRVPNDITLSDLVFFMGKHNFHLESTKGGHFYVPQETNAIPHEQEVIL